MPDDRKDVPETSVLHSLCSGGGCCPQALLRPGGGVVLVDDNQMAVALTAEQFDNLVVLHGSARGK